MTVLSFHRPRYHIYSSTNTVAQTCYTHSITAAQEVAPGASAGHHTIMSRLTERLSVCWKVAGMELSALLMIGALGLWTLTRVDVLAISAIGAALAHMVAAHKRIGEPLNNFETACALIDLAFMLVTGSDRRLLAAWVAADNETRSDALEAFERVSGAASEERGQGVDEPTTGRLS